MKVFSQYRGLRKELYVLLIGKVVTRMGSMIWPMFTLILNRKLGFDATAIALCILVYSIISIPVSLFGGKLADRLNKRDMIIVCDLVSIVSYIYCAAVPLTVGTMIVFAFASLFQSVEWPVYDALVADLSTSETRDKAFSLSYLGGNLGLVLSPTISGLLFNEHLNLAFLISGVAIAFSTVLIFFKIKDVHRETSNSAQAEYEKELDTNISAFKWLSKCRVIILFIAATALTESVYSMYGYLMPLDLSAIYGDRGSVLFGTLSSLNCIVVVCFTAIITSLTEKMKETGRMITGQALIFLGYVVFLALIAHPVYCYIAMVVFTWGEIVSTISASPFATRRIPASHRGRMASIKEVLGGLVVAAFRLLVGRLYDTMGSSAAWLAVLVTSGISIILLFVMASADRKDFKAFYR